SRRFPRTDRVSGGAGGREPPRRCRRLCRLAGLTRGWRNLPPPRFHPALSADRTAAPMFTPEELTTIALSVRVASVAALASLPLAVAVGWVLARRRFPGKALLDALVHLPLVLP